MWMNDANDFCLWGPPSVGTIGDTEREEVAWCTQSGRGTRVIPDGTLSGVHFVRTVDYIQVTGVGDFTKINVALGDGGGGKYSLVIRSVRCSHATIELDPHGAGMYYLSNHRIFLVRLLKQIAMAIPSADFYFRGFLGPTSRFMSGPTSLAIHCSACVLVLVGAQPLIFIPANILFPTSGPNARENCQHIYDRQYFPIVRMTIYSSSCGILEMGCYWNMPANYDTGVFESCQGDDDIPMGIYGNSTWYFRCQMV